MVSLFWHRQIHIWIAEPMNFVSELSENCNVTRTESPDYGLLIRIESIPGAQADGYSIRLPFHIQAEKDARIVLATVNTPNWQQSGGYEIALGEDENQQMIIRKRPQGTDLAQEYHDDILSRDAILRGVLEITNGTYEQCSLSMGLGIQVTFSHSRWDYSSLARILHRADDRSH